MKLVSKLDFKLVKIGELVGLVWEFLVVWEVTGGWVLRTKTSQEEQEQQLYPVLDLPLRSCQKVCVVFLIITK